MKKHRLLSILLAMAMVLTFMPAIAFADDAEAQTVKVAQIGDTQYDSLREAVNAINTGEKPEGSTIKLLKDDVALSFHDNENGGIPISKSMTIDGDGHTVKGLSFYHGPIIDQDQQKNVYAPDVISDENVKGFYIKSGNVTIKNLNMSEFGDKDYANKFGNVPVLTATGYNGTLTLENVNIDKFNRQAICAFGGTLVINGGTVNGNAGHEQIEPGKDVLMYGIEVRGSTNATISDVTVRGMDSNVANTPSLGIVSWSTGTVLLEDVDVDVKGYGIEPDANTVTVKGDKTTVKGTEGSVFVEEGGTLNIEGGIYSGEIRRDSDTRNRIAITGGAFNDSNYSQFVDANVAPRVNVERGSDILYVVGDATNYALEDGDKVDVSKAASGAFNTEKDVEVKNDTQSALLVNGTLVKEQSTINSKDAADISDKKEKLIKAKGAYETARQAGDADETLEAAKAYKDAADAFKSAVDKQTAVVDSWKDNADFDARKAATELKAAQNAADSTAKKTAAATAAAKEAALEGVLDPNLPKLTIRKPAKAKKALTAKWKKISKKKVKKVDGIEIWVSTENDFKTGRIIKTASKSKTLKKITKLQPKTNYYVKVRAFKNKNGEKHVGAWSKVKKIKTK